MEVPGRIKQRSVYDGIDSGSAELPDLLCQPCINDGDLVAAMGFCETCKEYLCAACLKFHRKQTVSRHHSVLEGACMPKGTSFTGDTCTELCSKHKNETVRYYCQTHDAVGCGDCRVLDHKTCDVSLVQDKSNDFVESGELTEINRKIDKVDKDIKKIKRDVESKLTAVKDNHKDILDDIRAFRKEVNDHLDKMEAEIIHLADRLRTDKEKSLGDVEESCTALETETETIAKDLQLKLSNNELFVKAKLAKKRLSEIYSEMKSLVEKCEVANHRYIRQSCLSRLLETDTILGEVTTDILSKDVMDLEPKYVGAINLKQENEIVCYISDAVFIEVNKMILVDRNNTCVKVVEVDKQEVLSVFNIDNRPFGIAVVSHDLVAVTVPAAQKLLFLSYKTELTERFAIQVSGDCIGIACKDNLLALTYSMPSKIEILTVTGTLLHSIQRKNIQIPSYIVFGHEPKTVFISNYHKKKVIKLDFDGQVLTTYQRKDLLNPAALMLTKDGHVMVCNSGEGGHSIHIISTECEKVNEMLKHDDHIENPTRVLFCEETSRFYVSNGTGSLIQNSNALKIYQCYIKQC